MATDPNWRSEQRRKLAKRLVLHYFKLAISDLHNDCQGEIESIMDSVFDEIDDASRRIERLSERLSVLEMSKVV